MGSYRHQQYRSITHIWHHQYNYTNTSFIWNLLLFFDRLHLPSYRQQDWCKAKKEREAKQMKISTWIAHSITSPYIILLTSLSIILLLFWYKNPLAAFFAISFLCLALAASVEIYNKKKQNNPNTQNPLNNPTSPKTICKPYTTIDLLLALLSFLILLYLLINYDSMESQFCCNHARWFDVLLWQQTAV